MIFLQNIPKKFNPPCIITRPWIYPEFEPHETHLTRGLNVHKYGNIVQKSLQRWKVFYTILYGVTK